MPAVCRRGRENRPETTEGLSWCFYRVEGQAGQRDEGCRRVAETCHWRRTLGPHKTLSTVCLLVVVEQGVGSQFLLSPVVDADPLKP